MSDDRYKMALEAIIVVVGDRASAADAFLCKEIAQKALTQVKK